MRLPRILSFLRAVPTDWRAPKALLLLFAIELAVGVPILALYGIADPDLYRTRLWEEGARNGWNSSPIAILYSSYNYITIKVPTPWNQFITNYNVIIAVLSLFVLLVKSVLYILHMFPPLLSLFLHGVLAALYAISIYNQAAPDNSDPAHPSKHPWYLTRGCGPPVSLELHGYCQQAQSAFAVTVVQCGVFAIYMGLSIFSAIPSRHSRSPALDSESGSFDGNEKWEMEMNRLPRSSIGVMNPMTPRTLAFNTLDGKIAPPAGRNGNKLPFRHHIAMGEETWTKSTYK
ncbi:hypothetical protein MMC25_004795 [Agyrium rufum]|nr:hypothetical protein [Agyrium rufum]